MGLFDYISYAFKNLLRQKMRTFLTITAITIGSLSVILMASLLTGIRQSLYSMFASIDAFTLVTVSPDPEAALEGGSGMLKGSNSPVDADKRLTDESVAKLIALPHVASATPVGSQIWIESMSLEGATKKTWPNLVAFEPQNKVFNITVKAGRELQAGDLDKIIVGAGMIKRYDLDETPESLVGKKVVLHMGGGSTPDWGPAPPKPPLNADKEWWESQNEHSVEITAEIIGVADSTVFDDYQNYISLDWAKRLMTQQRWEGGDNGNAGMQLTKDDMFTKNGYGSIMIKVDDTNNLAAVAQEIEKLGYGVTTAQDMIAEINKIFMGIGIILGTIGGIALFVAAIGIINTMIMATVERIKEIGVLRACGATRGTIRRLFTIEAALLGFGGGLFGLVLSYLVGRVGIYFAARYATDIPLPTENLIQFPWWIIGGVMVFTTVIGLLSGLGPAIKAARLNPVEALRYE